ncbi:MAG TPA: hypothetical protein VF075_03470, partial [Pyrinomonadaceae bacterium]
DAATPEQHALCNCGKLTPQRRDIVERLEHLDTLLSRFGLRVSFYQVQQVLVFESCECLFVHEA